MSFFAAKWLVIGLAVVALAASSYATGRKHVRALWDAERGAYALAAAQQAVANKERERQWTEYARQAEASYGKSIEVTTRAAGDERTRLRAAAATALLVPGATRAADGCPICAQCATRTELLGLGEEIVRVAEAADRERAALMSCATSWPR
jgi:hypothetical protein